MAQRLRGRTERRRLASPAPGTERTLVAWRWGEPGARPKVYLQASLHADEIPGMLVLERLAGRIERAARTGAVRGEIVLVPVANPIGLAQSLHGRALGRYAFAGGGNFNRGYPDLAPAVIERAGPRLGADAATNVALVRATLREALAAIEPLEESDVLRCALLALAIDADVALDLHCDEEAVLHVYTGTALWPAAADLAADLDAHAVLLANASGGHPFDEAVGGPWWALAERFPERPVPPACLSGTVELRGERDVSEALAEADAANLFRFLVRRGALAGDPGPVPAARAAATPLTAVDMVRTPVAGVLCHRADPGDRVEAGDAVAAIVDPLEPDAARATTELRTVTAGVVFGRSASRIVRPGQIVCKVAGAEPLAHRLGGNLLTD